LVSFHILFFVFVLKLGERAAGGAGLAADAASTGAAAALSDLQFIAEKV
jgi:hypothetical protein